jgi:glutaconate CoA-transferase subunit A
MVLPTWVVDAVSVAPGGSHPSYTLDYTARDNEFYREWDAIARDRGRFTAWIEQHVMAA